MNVKALIPLVVGIGIAGFAGKLGLDYIRNAQASPSASVELWTPIEMVGRGEAITETMIAPMPYPADLVPPGALTDKEQVIGRVPHSGAPKGVPILESMLFPPGFRPGIPVKKGFRAVAVKIDEGSGVDYHIQPGCRVDVIGMFSVRNGGRNETVAKTILEDVEIAAVGAQISLDVPDSEEGASKGSSKRDRPARAVTLLVKPNDVPMLHLAEQRGKIKLALRSNLDSSSLTRSDRIDEQGLLGDKPTPDETEPSKSWGEQFSEFVTALREGAEPPPSTEPVAPPEPPAPQYAFVVKVYNGDELTTLGFTTLSDMNPVRLSSEGPNIFQDEPQSPPTAPPPATFPPQTPPAVGDQPADIGDKGQGTPQPKEKPEPTELFE